MTSVFKSNQIKSLLLSHHHSTSALVSEILMSVLQTVQKNNRQFTYGQTVQKTALEHLQCSRQCKKKATAIYIWTVHIYRLYRRQCAKYTYIYSVHIVYYKDILNYQRHIIHRMGSYLWLFISLRAWGKKLSLSRLVRDRMLWKRRPEGSRESSLWDGWLESLIILLLYCLLTVYIFI